MRESLTPSSVSLSLWFRTTYPQLFAGISLRVETQVRYVMLDDGAELIVPVLLNAAACYWCLAKCAMVATDFVNELKVSIDFAACFNHSN